MLLSINISDKTIGPKHLLEGLKFTIEPKEKVAIIGRNGVGKTTLFNILNGSDDDYQGEIKRKRSLKIVATQQEFHHLGDQTTIEYICNSLPRYSELMKIIETYPDLMGSDEKKVAVYAEALDSFAELGYYDIENKILRSLAAFQITKSQAKAPFSSLSGGQKRFADLVRVELSSADLALIDEPTNHMDYVGKENFIKWLGGVNHAVVIITHDRDVLANVDRIIEIKDKKAFSFSGNYEAYLKQNGITTVEQISDYEVAKRTLVKLKKQILAARTKKMAASGDSAPRFRIMEERLQRQYDKLNELVKKPSFWVDQETVGQMPKKVAERYDKYKARNIRIKNSEDTENIRELLVVRKLSIGYEKPLFKDLNFTLAGGSNLEIKGRNGAGKTTLVKIILKEVIKAETEAKIFAGNIKQHPRLKLGYYEQEVSDTYLHLNLPEAITQAYRDKGASINDQKVKQIMSEYLFNPLEDSKIKVENLSGGQKARLQIIKMFCNNPNLLILDEPTNHLDLPSIEELEKALSKYDGAVLFVSHDSYFTRNLEAEVIEIGA